MQISDGNVVTAVVWACACVPIFLAATFLIWRLRSKYNVKARGTLAMVGQSLMYMCFFLWVCLGLVYAESDALCSVSIGSGIFVNILSLINVLRLWVLMFRFRIAAKLVSCGAKRPMDLDSDTGSDAHNSRVSDNHQSKDKDKDKDKDPQGEQQLMLALSDRAVAKRISTVQQDPQQAAQDSENSGPPSAATLSAVAAAVELEQLKQLHAGAGSSRGSGSVTKPCDNSGNNADLPVTVSTTTATITQGVTSPNAVALTSNAAVPTTSSYRRLHGIMTGPDSWFIRHRYLITKPWLATLFTVPLILLSAVAVPLIVLPDTCSAARQAAEFYSNFFIAFWCLVVVLLTVKIRKTDGDAFGIRTELRATALVAILAIIVSVAVAYASHNSILSGSVTNIFILGCYSTSTLWPLYIAFRTSEDQVTFQGLRDISTLADLLELDLGYESFLNYTTHEFAQENVLFWKAVQQFVYKYGQVDYFALTRRSECMNDARHIINQYIADNAPSQVNLPSVVRFELLQTWQAEVVRDASSVDLMPTAPIAGMMNTAPKAYKPAPIQIPQPKHLILQHQSPTSTTSTESGLSSAPNSGGGVHTQPLLSEHSSPIATSPVLDITGKKYSPTSVSLNNASEVSVSLSLSAPSTHRTLKPAQSEAPVLTLTAIPEQPVHVGNTPHKSSHSSRSHRRHQTGGNSSLTDDDDDDDYPHVNNDARAPAPLTASSAKHKKDTSGSRGLLTTLSVVTIFNQAAEEVYHLMVNDLLPRYLKSRDFVDFLQKMKEKVKNNEKEPSVSHGGGVLQSKAQLYRPVALNLAHASHLITHLPSAVSPNTNNAATYSTVSSTPSPSLTPLVGPAVSSPTKMLDDDAIAQEWTSSPLTSVIEDAGNSINRKTSTPSLPSTSQPSNVSQSPSTLDSYDLSTPPLSVSSLSENASSDATSSSSVTSTSSPLPPLSSRPSHALVGHSHHMSAIPRRTSSSQNIVNGVGVVHSTVRTNPNGMLKRDQSISTLASLVSSPVSSNSVLATAESPSPLVNQRPIVRMDLTLGTRLTEQPMVNLQDIVITDNGDVEIVSSPAVPLINSNAALPRLTSPNGISAGPSVIPVASTNKRVSTDV